MAVRVSTGQYEASHGRLPRGWGRWAFQIGEQIEWFAGTYTEARKLAIKQAQQEGVSSIEVLP
ncbi:MAG: hypothetical protein AB1424_00945 [Thermodesulfobacteriota bacterium]